MRVLIWHVDSFISRITEKGRSPVVEPMGERETRVGESILVLASVEKNDQPAPALVAERAAAMLAGHALQLKVDTVVLHSFAHLFADLAAPAIAVEVLKATQELLAARGLRVVRTPFGYLTNWKSKPRVTRCHAWLGRLQRTRACTQT